MGFLGPEGTFTEMALLTQPDLAGARLSPIDSIPGVLAAADGGEVDIGFVPIENAIEGTVNVTMDMLAFELDLLIQREVVINVELNLLAVPGASMQDIRTVMSIGPATAQCRQFLTEQLPDAVVEAANSTADAARRVAAGGDAAVAAIGTSLAAEIHGLDVLAADVEDHPENQTRFVVLARDSIPAPTGHDKTTVVIFQRADRPGSLLSILQEFSARAINLTKLESRPTKKGLGDYCFILDLEGHISEELVADCLRDLRSKQEDVRFLGSYPAAGDTAPRKRRDSEAAWAQADTWVRELQTRVDGA